MVYKIDFTNTGFIEDGVLTIDTVKNEQGYPDGTSFSVCKYDDNGKLLQRKTVDIEDLFEE